MTRNQEIKKSRNQMGFTLIEAMVSLALLVGISSFAFLSLSGVRNARRIRSGVNEVEVILRDARNRSRTQEGGTGWGVRLSQAGGRAQYELFSGAAYDPLNVVQSSALSSFLRFSSSSSGDDYVFSPITGNFPSREAVSLGIAGGGTLVGDVILQPLGQIHSRVHKGVLGYWRFDEASGDALDSTLSGYDGILLPAVSRQSGVSCLVGGCIEFSGSPFSSIGGTMSVSLSQFTVMG